MTPASRGEGERRRAGVLLLGIDEAGFGPFLGPLCVGAALLRVETIDQGKPPCLWSVLREAVCRAHAESTPRRPRLCVNDSKALKRSVKPGPQAHAAALADIELSVLAFASLLDPAPIVDDAGLFERLASPTLRDDARADPRTLPLNHDPSLVGLRASALTRVAEGAGVGLLGLRVAALEPSRFNAECERLGSKAAVSACLGLSRLQDLWARLGEAGEASTGYAFLDRQGGRTDYSALVSAIDPEARIETLERGDDRSAYVLRDGARELRVLVEVGADSKRFPTALASMAAKYARDLAMLRFNDRFCREFPDLKPTQGYGTDGRRWISDASSLLTPERLGAIVRQR